MALGSAETWGEFRTQVSTERMREIDDAHGGRSGRRRRVRS